MRIETEPGSPLLWEISVEGAPQAIEAAGLNYGVLNAVVSTKRQATAAE